MTPGSYFVRVSWSTSLAGVVVSRAVLPLHVVCGGLRLTSSRRPSNGMSAISPLVRRRQPSLTTRSPDHGGL